MKGPETLSLLEKVTCDGDINNVVIERLLESLSRDLSACPTFADALAQIALPLQRMYIPDEERLLDSGHSVQISPQDVRSLYKVHVEIRQGNDFDMISSPFTSCIIFHAARN